MADIPPLLREDWKKLHGIGEPSKEEEGALKKVTKTVVVQTDIELEYELIYPDPAICVYRYSMKDNHGGSVRERLGLAKEEDIKKFLKDKESTSLTFIGDLSLVGDGYFEELKKNPIGWYFSNGEDYERLKGHEVTLNHLFNLDKRTRDGKFRKKYLTYIEKHLIRWEWDSHLIFYALTKKLVPHCVDFNYLGGFMSNDKFELRKVREKVFTDEDIKYCGEVESIEYYNQTEGRTHCLRFHYFVDGKKVDLVWKIANEVKKEYPSTCLREVVIGMDLLGIKKFATKEMGWVYDHYKERREKK